ncbi:ATPase NPA3 [Magnaporthiopsis poae ATCC 64411]|uniref:GPN-loop GTPase n=1 Tax=Magnaporthiopsis poae (strain ATCC 64411 / 73-15) TaxID=644358 RepID=A0A0C4DKJ0_MAGP6|nr:ATPase NPA3 [Magnaporthiopsis poae ATCC 64411]
MASAATSAAPSQAEKPVAVVCVGMAGSGKTTFMQRINAHLHGKKDPPYVINLDPAVLNVPFDSNIDIRDSVNYKEVMRQYNLGPNGGILTALNLFATKVDQVIDLLEKRTARNEENAGRKPINHILVDTPGQIEAFVWSASGTILLESLASSFPTVIAYIVDTPRTRSTSTFMSNMLYACSILYKTKLPMILVFNKTDVVDASFAKEWMTDFEAFQAALRKDEESNAFGSAEGETGAGGSGYMSSLLNSMSMMLEEFYAHLNVVGVSSMTGAGTDEFFAAVATKAEEFRRDYQPELERRREEREEAKKLIREQELEKMMKGMSFAGDRKAAAAGKGKGQEEEQEDPAIAELGKRVDAIDSDDSADDDEMDNEGLQARYEAAVNDALAAKNQDISFANYLRRQGNE